MFAVLTGAGLSAAAGLNAYIPFLIVGLLARFTDVITLPGGWQWIESWWALGIGAVLLISELVLDKIPVVDSVNDIAGSVIRPATGGVIAAATQSANALDHSSFLQDHEWIAFVGGLLVAGVVHVGKASARPAVNLGTAGIGAPIVSTVEDASSLGLSLIAVFVPILVIVALIVLAWALWKWARRMRGFARRRRDAEHAT
ncbi:membrane protein [Flexivirga endophytica]|uniref:Membrane protein n=1 Tax=Flexivirga endophytica TaxID=1849103 RepID=A0A916X0A9_9MICO|nr:DUF4126 domain-containing protein [Flexivirga endophytica]GGB47858.1 membrane protein [Flexivirga endophytica]GHB60811.1 membrane protein [Flexivirga endophytica]